jgi:hypothetical protein
LAWSFREANEGNVEALAKHGLIVDPFEDVQPAVVGEGIGAPRVVDVLQFDEHGR